MKRFVVLVEFVCSEGGFTGLEARGIRDFSEVVVLAETLADAHLLAAQIVGCRNNIQVTRTFPSI